jgi:hypothetical protein
MRKEINKNKLLELVHDRIKKHGVRLNKRLAEFTEKQKDGWNKFQLIFLNRHKGWGINIGMLIRKNLVEDIYHQASYFAPEYHKTTPTIGITVESFINDGKKNRCYLNSENDIVTCMNYIEDLFIKIVLPFFKEYDSLEKMDEAVNIKNGISIFSGLKYEGNLGIILAKLVKNPDYTFFLKKYRDYYIHFSDGFYLPEFEKLTKVLETLPSG